MNATYRRIPDPGVGPVMLDLAGSALDAEDRRRIRHPLTGGIILFARNFESRRQLSGLVAAIRSLRPELPIAVDHEGGRVQRFKSDGFTHLPAMRRLGEIWDDDPRHGALRASQLATAAGYVLAAELRACDIDLSFTPVLDLDYGTSSVIGDRAFHRDARVVSLLAKSLNHGLMLAGMTNCGKHFPGHGFVAADSHLAVPVDDRPLEAILADDAEPYGWLSPFLAGVMPAHVIYSRVDPHPAGFSRFWLKLLRERYAFSGVIFSDDLSMEGASVAGNVVQRANAALHAGCDMVLVCNAPDQADLLLARLKWEAASHIESIRRIAALRPANHFPDWESLQAEPRYIQSRKLLAGAGLIAAG